MMPQAGTRDAPLRMSAGEAIIGYYITNATIVFLATVMQ